MPVEAASLGPIIFTGVFYGSVLFLIAAGLQLVFGVQKILNLTCGSLYAIGAYTGITFIELFAGAGYPTVYLILVLLAAGLFLCFLGPIIERGALKPIYGRDESFQLLATFALVIIFEDAIRFVWGVYPIITKVSPLVYGEFSMLGDLLPVYYLLIIIIGLLIAILIGFMIKTTKFGKMLRAVSDDRYMSEALGVDVSKVYLMSFTLGAVLGTVAGSLMAPVTAAVLGMGVEAIVLAFAVVVIGGLGSMIGAFIGSMTVGVVRSITIATYAELETFVIYIIVIIILLVKPSGLFGRVEE